MNTGPLKVGDIIQTGSGQSLKVLAYLGEGGQGYVYKIDLCGEPYALKWYKQGEFLEHIDSVAFWKSLSAKIAQGAPAPQFLWPEMLTKEYNGTFGYVMKLFPDGYTSLEDYYWGKAYFPSWLAVIDTALSLVEGFMILHRKGYSYQDLNYGGFRTNPNIGDSRRVLICDNDNVSPDGTNLGIQGFRGFMAPEVTTGNSFPNTLTDLHSLAVVLFGLFFRGHPLEGKHTLQQAALCTPSVDRIIYGSHPIFCFHPTDDRNRPDPIIHKCVLRQWLIFTNVFKECFVKAFTIGLYDQNKRILETDWRKALIGLRSSIAYITNGSTLKEQFVDLKSGTMPHGCFRLRFADGQVVALSHGARLYACQTSGDVTDFRKVTASIATYQNSLFMRNDTDKIWRFSFPGQAPEQVDPKGILPLVPGVTINFAGVGAVVEQ